MAVQSRVLTQAYYLSFSFLNHLLASHSRLLLYCSLTTLKRLKPGSTSLSVRFGHAYTEQASLGIHGRMLKQGDSCRQQPDGVDGRIQWPERPENAA